MPDTTLAPTTPQDDLTIVRNRTFDEIAIGDSASIERTLTSQDIQLFALLSGDVNPQHLDAEFAASTRFHGVIAHGMLGGALISAVLGTRLPGPGTIYLGQTLKFLAPVRIGDRLRITVTVSARDEARKRLTLACSCVNQDGATVISGEAQVVAPTERVERARTTLPEVRLQVRQELSQAWIMAQAIEQRDQVLTGLLSENQRLQDSLPARIAGGTAQAADLLMARQEALALSDRRDDLQRDRSKARAMLRRWVGARADEALQGTPGPLSRPLDQLRSEVHRHAELAQYPAMQAMALAETREAQAETKGDWSWEVAYSRRDRRWGDMVSFQVTFDLPWQQERRQGPQIKAKQLELQRLDAEQEDVTRRHLQELEDSASELAALNSQIERLQSAGMGLAQGRAELALANYQSAKGDLSAVLAARAQVRETHWRLIDLQAQRDTVIARLNSLIAD
jgi:acyl dehydratase